MGSFRNWLGLLRRSGGVDRQFMPRVAFVTLTTLLSSPLRVYERLRYSIELSKVHIDPPPIFILGHWRTGTTHLHNLLCQDPAFGYVTTFQGVAPGFCLSGRRWIKALFTMWASRIHPTRIIDNIPLSMDAPQEEDFALANLSPYSFLHQYTFPRQAEAYFTRYALMDGLDGAEMTAWRDVYLGVLRKAVYSFGGRRLLIKGPANSGRIPAILQMFPGAKFIHISRNPYVVFVSTLHTFQNLTFRYQVQASPPEQIEAMVLKSYRWLMQRYLRDAPLIPPENLVEIKFEDLEAAPLEVLRRVYEGIGLPGFERVENNATAYLASINGYQKNHYSYEDSVIENVNREWSFAFDAWGYERIDRAIQSL